MFSFIKRPSSPLALVFISGKYGSALYSTEGGVVEATGLTLVDNVAEGVVGGT